ncbi:MAG TPA: (2Fe-2S)-binding protein [bacterium]|nr:(2Fe-2S)-binding protein [bacterium]HOL47667.1 (2Fe-2S)-binding protein [bacterium]HPQ18424.1 (2Fe-2S)-binding protein [bacterium]
MDCNCCSKIKNENIEFEYICYCNKITKTEIIDTIKKTGVTNIKQIKSYLRNPVISDCVNQHPLKRCCDPEFKKVIEEVANINE